MFDRLIAPNPRLNASLAQGRQLVRNIINAGISPNPRLYANQTGMDGFEIPEKDQDNSDLPGWATQNSDGSTLESLAVPDDLPIYLQVWVGERQNFYDVAQVQSLQAVGISLSQALS